MSLPEKTLKSALKRLGAAARAHGIMDAIQNTMTGVGTSRSKVSYNSYTDDPPLDVATLEALFANNDLAHTIVAKPVEDALRAWFTIECDGDDEDEHEACEKVCEELRRLCARRLIEEGAVWGRLLGGGGLVIVAEGAGGLDTELDDEAVTSVVQLVPWDRQDMVASSWNGDGSVRTYTWTPYPETGHTLQVPMTVHASRMLRFPGMLTTRRRKAQNEGWDLSVLQKVYEVLRSFDSMWASTDAMFADASQAVFKMRGLIESLAESDGEGRADVTVRLQFMDAMRSAVRAIMLDAGNTQTGEQAEEFQVVERATLGSLDKVMQNYMIRLATAARMPLTVLLGMSPAGMDATGEGDMILYYNNVDILRLKTLEPQIIRLVRIVARTVGVAEPEDLKIVWPELARPKPMDIATAEKMRIDSAVALVNAQSLLPEEIALNLTRIAPTLGIKIDLESRRTAMALGLEDVESREAVAPEPVAGGAEPAAPNQPKVSNRATNARAQGRQPE